MSDTSFALRGHAASIFQAMFDSSGRRVVTIHADDTVKIWDTTPFHATAVRSPDNAFPTSARLDARGDRSLNGVFDNNGTYNDDTDDRYTVIVRDTQTGRRALVVESRGDRFDAAISGDGHVVAVATVDGKNAKIWDVDSRTARASLKGTGDIFRTPALDARGTRAVTASGRAVRIWDARSGKLERVVSVKGVIEASFSPDGRVVALMSKQAGSLWDAETGELITRLHGSGDIFRRPQFSPDGTLLATHSGDGAEVNVWDASSGASRRTGFGPSGVLAGHAVVTTAFSADNRQLLTMYDFGELRVWDVASGQLLIEPPAQVFARMNTVLDVAFSPDRTRVTLLSDNAPLYKYDCPLCAPTKALVNEGDARVSEAVKRNALALSLQ